MIDDFDPHNATQNSHYSSYPLLSFGWIYIAIDIRHINMVKIGITRQETPEQRVSQGKTYNPFLVLFATYELSKCTYGVSQEELNDIEGYIQCRSFLGGAIKHMRTERDSEWFICHPDEAESQIDWVLAKRGFSVDGKHLYDLYCGEDRLNGINVEKMKKIKKIYRPLPESFYYQADAAGIPFELFEGYYSYLEDFHSRDVIGKIYLSE